VLVAHRVDDDRRRPVFDAVLDHVEVVERTERRAERHVLELELLGVLQRATGLGVDYEDLPGVDALKALG
jgi:hypothetical protein